MRINNIQNNLYNNSICPNRGVSFGHTKNIAHEKFSEEKNDKKVLASTIVLSVGAVLATLAGIAKFKRGKGLKDAKMFNMHLQEPEIFALGTATVVGALAGGCLFDKPKNYKSKARESSHQFVGNIVSPLVCMYALNKGLEKLNFKMPNIKGNSKLTKAANICLDILPSLTTSCVGLWTGINIGNKISEKINDKIFGKPEKKREVKAIDYCVHIDDPITVLTVADKSGNISKLTSKIMPFTFILSGYQIGVAKSDK